MTEKTFILDKFLNKFIRYIGLSFENTRIKIYRNQKSIENFALTKEELVNLAKSDFYFYEAYYAACEKASELGKHVSFTFEVKKPVPCPTIICEGMRVEPVFCKNSAKKRYLLMWRLCDFENSSYTTHITSYVCPYSGNIQKSFGEEILEVVPWSLYLASKNIKADLLSKYTKVPVTAILWRFIQLYHLCREKNIPLNADKCFARMETLKDMTPIYAKSVKILLQDLFDNSENSVFAHACTYWRDNKVGYIFHNDGMIVDRSVIF